jgi:hypothetical protein
LVVLEEAATEADVLQMVERRFEPTMIDLLIGPGFERS